nr:hypothetical protein GCM10020093_073520 [Planobispora longispora]
MDGRACGTFGDMGVWSFDHAKIVVTVDGGMLYVRDPELAARAPKVAYLGLEPRAAASASPASFHSGYDQALRSKTRWWDYDVVSFSGRSTTNDVLSAIGVVQLDRLGSSSPAAGRSPGPTTRAWRPGRRARAAPAARRAHLLVLHVLAAVRGRHPRRDRARPLRARHLHHLPLPLMHQVKAYGSDAVLPRAEAAAARTLLLPIHQSLSDADVDRVVTEVRACVTARRRRTRAA